MDNNILEIVEKNGNKFLISKYDALGLEIKTNPIYENHFLDLVNSVVKFGDTCIDCSANLGFHTVHLSKIVGNAGKVYSFEPIRTIYWQLLSNCLLNGCYNVIPYHNALSDIKTRVKVTNIQFTENYTNIGGLSVENGEDLVDTISLMDLNLEKIDFIKLDIQGYEFKVLVSLSNIIDKFFPNFCIELEEPYLNKFNSSSQEIINYLLNYQYILLQPKIDYPADHFAIHRSKIGNYNIKYENYNIIDCNRVKLQFSSKYNGCVYSSIEKQ
jgi:FkbM family methyltransferase